MKRHCTCCHGSNLLAARAVDKSDGRAMTLCVQTYANPNAAIFKGVREATLQASVCRDCGHVMYFASHRDIDTLLQGTV
jgi:hypothetical protein